LYELLRAREKASSRTACSRILGDIRSGGTDRLVLSGLWSYVGSWTSPQVSDMVIPSSLSERPARWTLLILAVLAAAALVAGAVASAADYPAGFEERTMVSGLTEPTNVAWAPDGRMFVVEKRGTLKVVPPGGTTAATILDISARVNDYKDRGLLGLALDSNFASNGYVYLLYTYELRPLVSDSDSGMVSRLGRFTVSQSNAVSAETVLLGTYASDTCPTPSNTVDCIPSDGLSHSIGTVISAPDGTLWVGSGDAASYSMVDTRAFRTYDERSLAGKILHVDRNGRGLPGHAFCPTNTDLAHNCTKLHAKGFRNPFRFTLRPGGGLVVGDVGWSQWEEVDLVRTAGKSYGWPCYEGTSRTSGYRDRSECATEYAKEGTPNAHVAPDHIYPNAYPDPSGSAVMGGPTVTGGGYPASYSGDIFFGDYAAGFVKRIGLDGSGNISAVSDFATDLYAVSLQTTPNGELAYVSFGDGSPGTGSIKRVVYAADNRSPTAVARATPESGPAPLEVGFDGSGSGDPDGDALTYEWSFGDGTPPAGGAQPTHTYTVPGNYTARLTVRDGKSGTASATAQIVVGDSPPQATIASPPDNSTYRNGQLVAITGTGTDAQDGTLPASAFHWVVRLHHGGHLHPVTTVSGTKTPSFSALDDHDADSHYEVTVTVTDSSGLTDSETIRLNPETVRLTLASQPTGAPVTYAGVSGSAPLARRSATGFRTTISAAERFNSGGREWVFDHWSDGGARQHDVTVPAADATVTAHYSDAAAPSLVAAPAIDSCSDGIDSDGDGRVDLGDLEYGNAAGVPSRSCDQVHTSCLDLTDNDGDGRRDWDDADVNGGDGILATTRCDQAKPAVVPKSNQSLPVRLLCNKFIGRRGRNVAYRTRAPRRCAIWRANWAHYQALTFIKARWTGWGKPTARARVTITADSGYRERARIKAYRLRPDCTGDDRVYTRVALLPSGKRRTAVVFKPDTCAGK
jgi:glucose/arabinose dehydrogenase